MVGEKQSSPRLLALHGLPNLTLPIPATFEPVGKGLVVVERLVYLILRAQDERPILDNGLIQGSACDQNCTKQPR
jgi:hypothetical protein